MLITSQQQTFKNFLFIGWNGRTKMVIEILSGLFEGIDITLIDETLENTPFENENIKFIKGVPMYDGTLLEANIENKDVVIITADQYQNEQNADKKSIISLLSIKGMKPSVYTIVEIQTSEQVNNAKRAGANEIIRSSKIASD
ncbi:NAD-binding protein [Caldibacillus thermoamylovorans]|jgi:voltage-gated potassium channel|uniref:NAD-binding protein n=1 Tax=Bacillaceae TaxID=186817 RepID=UPI000D551A41|nr:MULTISPECIES: NAD-binding protein [Caldibacillus]MCB5935536.1 NAD-binding protein [Bacillus sp. DFI.2.34]AWI14033.1 hypothetical protein CQJ30_18850 [Caldibacillus thermoamylovorans]MCB7069915.1 NAD-binding protein [Caldibacillus sp. 210928-DFI.2.22]MCB7073307.1 NAD-binding protein [Caldibacillus sp. 210928-DFI.2.18]MCB7076876.1 NAD-binding protein [Caldibacillus thermoamylovorans]